MSYDITPNEPDTEEMKRELKAAGWNQFRMTMWRSPGGQYYRGPYGAWKHMKGFA